VRMHTSASNRSVSGCERHGGGHQAALMVQEVIALSVTDLVDRLTHLVTSHRALFLVRPWLAIAQLLFSDRYLLRAPCQLLTALSEDVRRRAFRAVHQLGLVSIVPGMLVHARPCAVKVLSQDSCSRGAYGARSAENEVLITLHVSAACAHCPFVGKALGFEYATALADSPNALLATDPLSASAPPTALLLALEPYTMDLDAALATRQKSQQVQPQQHASQHGERDGAQRRSSSESGDSRQSRKRQRDASGELATADVAAAGLPRTLGVAVNLWQYLLWLREHGMHLSVAEMRAFALQLARALHSLHADAHVMHLDVKPQNALMTEGLELRLIDYGFAAAFQPDQPFIRVSRSGRGTPLYTAPEMLHSAPRLITPAADVYSFGGCLLTICASAYLAEPCSAVLGPGRGSADGAFAAAAAEAAGEVQLPGEVPEPFRVLIAVRYPTTFPAVACASGLLVARCQRSARAGSAACARFGHLLAVASHKCHLRLQKCLRHRPSARPTMQAVIADLEATPTTLHLPPPPALLTPPTRDFFAPATANTLRLPSFRGVVEWLGVTATPTGRGPLSPGRLTPAALSPIQPTLQPAGSSPPKSGLLHAALSAMSSAPLSHRSSAGESSFSYHGNHVGPEDLGATPGLRELSVETRSTRAMRYTKSLRQGLAGMLRAPSAPSFVSDASVGSLCWHGAEASCTFSRSSSGGL
jgi:serine/threonine protein kinase